VVKKVKKTQWIAGWYRFGRGDPKENRVRIKEGGGISERKKNNQYGGKE